MSYRPVDAHDSAMPHDYYGYRQGHYPDHARRYNYGEHTVIAIIRVLTVAIVATFVLRAVFVVLGANESNTFVSFDHVLARTLVFGMGEVFTPQDAALGIVLNYSFAALVYGLIYVVVAVLVMKALRRP